MGLAGTRWMVLVAWHSSLSLVPAEGEPAKPACSLKARQAAPPAQLAGEPCAPAFLWWAFLGRKTDGISRKLCRIVEVELTVPILWLSEALQKCCLELPWQGLLQDFLPRRKQLPSFQQSLRQDQHCRFRKLLTKSLIQSLDPQETCISSSCVSLATALGTWFQAGEEPSCCCNKCLDRSKALLYLLCIRT